MSVTQNKALSGSLTVSRISRNVKINRTRLEEFATHFDRSTVAHWSSSCPVKFSDLPEEERLAFLFVFNAISFSYWGEPKWKIEFEGKPLERGTWSMLAAFKHAIQTGHTELLDAEYLREMPESNLANFLRGSEGTIIPLLNERFRILRELGRTIAPHRFTSLILDAVLEGEGSLDATALVDFITRKFPSFSDVSTYGEIQIPFNKRAQLLVSDMSALMPSGSIYIPKNTSDLTACADYILPMVLRHFRILEYSPELSGKVDRGVPLVSGGPEEVEIRANTIAAVYMLSELLGISQMKLNDYFWNLGPEIPRAVEHHIVHPATTAY